MPEALSLIRHLVGAFEREGIVYCHWKSNEAIQRSASGENDLDLLVERAHAGRARKLLHEAGFIEAEQRQSRRLPGILDYFGYDAGSQRPVHVHLHTRLVIGDDMTKNYHLPLETAYLASCTSNGLFLLPSVEFEYLVFVLRMMVKHCSWDATVTFQGRLTVSERRELAFLSDQVSHDRVLEILGQHMGHISRELFEECSRALDGGSNVGQRVVSGYRLERALVPFASRRRLVEVPLKTMRRAYWMTRRYVAPRSRRKSVAHGGLIVAIAGGSEVDRRGLVSELDNWLSHDLAVLPVEYSKKPRRSARRAQRFVARGGIVLTADYPQIAAPHSSPGALPSVWLLLAVDGKSEPLEAQPNAVVLDTRPGEASLVNQAQAVIWRYL